MAQHHIQRRLIKAFQAECHRVRRETAADLAGTFDEMRKVTVAQNVLRTCMEAAVEDAIPFGRLFPLELAIRLASYAVSILPREEQAAAIDMVIAALPEAHRQRAAQGITIKAGWDTVPPADRGWGI